MTPEETQPDPIAADWLVLRRPIDDQARQTTLDQVHSLVARLGPFGSVIDVGAGTGANTAWLARHLSALGQSPHWTLLDHDSDLLNNIDLPPEVAFSSVSADLADVAAIAANSPQPRLVTASALLDVLSFPAIDSLVGAICEHTQAALLALSVTGDLTFNPAHPFDINLMQAFNRHQARGNLSGPAGVRTAQAAFEERSWQVELVATPWILDDRAPDMTSRWLSDRVAAASELLPDSQELADWAAERTAQVDAGDLRVTVEHLDLFAWPDGAHKGGNG